MRGPRVDVVRAEAEPAAGPELINESERTSGKTRVLGEPGAAFHVEGLLNIFFCLAGSCFTTSSRGGFGAGAVLGWRALLVGLHRLAPHRVLLCCAHGDAAWPTPMGKVTSFLLAAIDALVAYN